MRVQAKTYINKAKNQVPLKGDQEFSVSSQLTKILQEDSRKKQPVFLEVKPSFLDELPSKLKSFAQNCFFFSIGGEPASGKTELLNQTSQAIENKSITRISMDNYFEDISNLMKKHGDYGVILDNGYDPHNPKTQDIKLIKKHLEQLKQGKSVSIPDYDFVSCKSFPNSIKKTPAKLTFVEGMFALSPELKDVFDAKIYVETPDDIIYKRYIERAKSRGKTEETAKKFFDLLAQSTEKYIKSTKQYADIIINGNAQLNDINQAIKKISSTFIK